jgi:hypothetical protein
MTTTQKVMAKKALDSKEAKTNEVYTILETSNGDADVLATSKDISQAKSYVKKQIYRYMKDNPIDKNDGGKYIVHSGSTNSRLERHYFMEIDKQDTAWDETILKYKIVKNDLV